MPGQWGYSPDSQMRTIHECQKLQCSVSTLAKFDLLSGGVSTDHQPSKSRTIVWFLDFPGPCIVLSTAFLVQLTINSVLGSASVVQFSVHIHAYV